MWDEYAEPASQPTEAPHDHAMTRAELHGSVAQAVQPTPVQDEPAGPVASSSHVDFDLAFERIDQGEKIGAVADDLRVPLHLLKSKWAKHIADNTPATIEDVQTNLPAVSGEPDLETAFLRIRAGETVKDVAADMGFKFPSLRGKWANKQRRRSDGDTESCRLCDRQFKPCADSDGLCARCTHG
ncbi:hypothetical protein P775_11140 [Puniceibacterium antarcticum]|uniref:Uncharacterized protein n=2 Tax=Puniceibacterium antarcticum TaxID=1206336 RepID=A0A2G8RFE7_9RHOB|nr:hypothetical protein P775_11140 [Puniceibacterium antarcticum]